jgi:hypothetical protein
VGHRPRGRRTTREPGRGQDAKDRPALSAWGSRQGAVVIPAPTDWTVKTVQRAAAIAVKTGRRRSTASASSDRAVQGSGQAGVPHPQQAEARGAVHEKRAEGLFSLRKPSLRVFRGVRK